MGNVTAKTSGEIASFMTPAKTNIKSLKVHFSPKQLGTGDPSPENVREIVGWDGVEAFGSGKNIAHIVGYSAKNSNSNNDRSVSNNYGTTINTTEFLLPDTELVVTQTRYPNTSNVTTYANGYIAILVDNLIWGKKYNVSFKINNIINNPLNVELKDITLLNPYGTVFSFPTIINNNYIVFKNVTWRQYSNTAINRRNFEIRICGMSFTLSEFMVTPVDEDDFEYEPYQGTILSYQWKLPDEYQEVEYIESTGTQYIDTGVIGKPNIKVETDFELTDSTNISNCGFIGSRENSGQTRFYIISFYQNKWHLGLPNDIYSSTYAVIRNQIQNVIFQSIDGSYSLIVDGTELYNGNSTFSTTYPMYLFGVNNYGKVSRMSSFKLYTLKIQQDGNYIRNFIPCYRKSDGEIGLYDLLSQTFYTNQGTGEFLKGEDVNKTFYGGYVDLISGELVEEYTYTEPNDNQWYINTNYAYQTGHPVGATITKTTYKKNICNYWKNNTWDNKYFIIVNESGNLAIGKTVIEETFNGDYTADGIEEILANFKTNNSPLIVTYPLKTPITHQLTPTQLQSFVGQNNFWSNADYVEIEYELKETEDIQKARKKIILNQPHIETVTGDVVNFTTNMKAPLKECKVYFEPVQEGSGDPNPDNVRNIVGWNGVNLYKCKKNLVLESSIIDNCYVRGAVTSTGTEVGSVSNVSGYKCTDFIKVLPNTTYTITFGWINAAAAGLAFYSDTYVESVISGVPMVVMEKSPYTFITPSNCNYIRFTSRPLNTFMGLVQGSVELIENVYDGTNISTTWSDEVGTVYGGYIDLVKGEVVAEYEKVDLSTLSIQVRYTGEVNKMVSLRLPQNYVGYPASSFKGIYCSTYKYIKAINGVGVLSNPDECEIGMYTYRNSSSPLTNIIYFVLPKDQTPSGEVVYCQETPIHYPLSSLTPQQLLTSKGANNIWSDANGQTEVKFWTH